MLPAHVVRLEAARVERSLRMVGDPDVAPPARPRRLCHLGHARLAIGIGAVAVQYPSKLIVTQQVGQGIRRRGADFLPTLTQLGDDERKAQRGVERFLIGQRDRAALGVVQLVAA